MVMAPTVGSLPTTWETWIESPAPGFSPDPTPQAIVAFGKGGSRQELALCLSLSLMLSLSLTQIHLRKCIKEREE